jgi:hypothetical protein
VRSSFSFFSSFAHLLFFFPSLFSVLFLLLASFLPPSLSLICLPPSQLLQPDETKRLGYHGIQEVKSHPFFNGFDWDGFLSRRMPPPFIPETTQVHAEFLEPAMVATAKSVSFFRLLLVWFIDWFTSVRFFFTSFSLCSVVRSHRPPFAFSCPDEPNRTPRHRRRNLKALIIYGQISSRSFVVVVASSLLFLWRVIFSFSPFLHFLILSFVFFAFPLCLPLLSQEEVLSTIHHNLSMSVFNYDVSTKNKK